MGSKKASTKSAKSKASKAATLQKPPQTKKALIEKIESERRLLEISIEGLSEAELIQPGAMGDWSVKDIMAHLSAWESRLEQRVRGEPEAGAELGTPAYNEHIYRENQDQPLAEVQAEFQQSHERVLALAQGLSPAEVRQWWQAFAFNTHGHYRWAKTQVRRWVKRRTV